MKKITISEGKRHFLEIVERAAGGEPQVVTENGEEVAVVLSYSEYVRLKEPPESLAQFLLNSPLKGSELELERDRDTGRETTDFSEE